MDQQEHINKIAFVIFKDQKVLLARYKDNKKFYFIGGKIRDGESDRDCLMRKVPDEIASHVDPESLVFLQEFEDNADGRENTLLSMRLYTGNLLESFLPNNDVEELLYCDSNTDPQYLSAIAIHKVFPWLKEHGYIS